MALRAVPDHPKFAEFKALLKVPRYAALGCLESIWHFTGRFTPQGNIGKYSDSAIEAWCEWRGEPGALIAALVQSHWIDDDPDHRLLVHDWATHADKATKNSLNRTKQNFCTPTVRTPYPLPVPEPVPVPVPEPVPEPVVSPSALPEPAAAPPVKRKAKHPGLQYSPGFVRFWGIVWAKIGKDNAFHEWESVVPPEIENTVIEAAAAQRPRLLREAANRGGTPLHPATWLHGRRWMDEEPLLPLLNGHVPVRAGPRDRRAEASDEFDRLMLEEIEKNARKVH